MVIYCSGQEIKLSNNDYIAEGGEGTIYVKNNIIYKIYHQQTGVLPAAKFKELSELKKDNIITPINYIHDKKNNIIGITMKFVPNTAPLSRIFTTGFRNRNNITSDMSIHLVENIAETIQYIHSKNILMVDGNEFNYLIDGANFINSYFIDVDSYQTKTYPAKVIMPSIRDWCAKDFSIYTDWFSFAIIAVQIFIGIHPFKGTHPQYDKSDIKARMLSHTSVFNKQVSVPPVTRDFGLIPKEYLAWFIELFEKGKRTLPPTIITKMINNPQQVIVSGGDKFIINNIFEADTNIIDCDWIHGNRIIYTQGYIYINNRQFIKPSKTTEIIYFENDSYFVDIIDGNLIIINSNNLNNIPVNIKAKFKIIINNRLYVIYNDNLIEIKFKSFNSQTIITNGNVWNILPNSTKLFKDVIYSDILGKAFLYIPFKEDTCQIIGINELKGHKILDAKFENNICILLSHHAGVYCRSIIKFDDDLSKYRYEVEEDIILNGVNFVALSNGVYLYHTGDGDLIISSKLKDTKNILTDVHFGNNPTLCHCGQDVYYFTDKILYSIKMK